MYRSKKGPEHFSGHRYVGQLEGVGTGVVHNIRRPSSQRVLCVRFERNAYSPTNFRCGIALFVAMADWWLTSLELKLTKIGAEVVLHARAITFQLAWVAVTDLTVRAILPII